MFIIARDGSLGASKNRLPVAERTYVLYHRRLIGTKCSFGDALKSVSRIPPNDPKKPAWGNRQLNTINAIFDAIQYLDMPRPSREFILALLKSIEWGRFKTALEECLRINNKTPDIDTKRYLFGIVSCASAEMREKLEQLGYSGITDAMLLQIGASQGMHFRGAVIDAASDDAHNRKMAIEQVAETVDSAAKSLGVPVTYNPNNRAKSSPSTTITSSDAGQDLYRSVHVYGGGTAFCFNASTTRTNHFAIMVDAAVKKANGAADWGNAIKIQLDHKELPFLYGVLVGWVNSAKFGAHGKTNEKSMEIERQSGHFYLKVMSRGDELRSVQITGEDSFHVTQLALTQIIRESPAELRPRPDIIIHLMKEAHFIRPVQPNSKETS